MWAAFCTQWVDYEHSAVCGVAAFFLSLVANLCAESNLQWPRCFVVWFIQGPEDTRKQWQQRPAEVSHSLVPAAEFHGVGSRAVTIQTRAVGLAPFITAAHGWQVHPLSTGPCPLFPFLPVLPLQPFSGFKISFPLLGCPSLNRYDLEKIQKEFWGL